MTSDPDLLADLLAQLPAWLAQGQSALDEQRYRDAAEAFERAAGAFPAEFALHQMAANAWRLTGDIVRERQRWRTAFDVALPRDIESLHTLGTGLLDTGAPTEARRCFERVVSQRPRDAAALAALASARRADGDPEGAWPLVQRALTLAHKMPALFLTAAQVRHALGDTAGARTWLAKAEKIRPGHPRQRIQLAFSYLLEGASSAGWEAFEARGLPALPPGARPWRGEPLAGQSIAVVMEQGLGDLFHFVRYVRRLEMRGPARVVVECPPAAVRLLAASGFDVVPSGHLPNTDWAVPLLSLPLHLAADADTASDLVPYLRTGEAAPAGSPSPGRRRIGVVTSGNPAFLSTRLRDLPATDIRRVLGIPGLEWVWLQFSEPVPSDLPAEAIVETPHLSGDWYDTARLLGSLDALVSVDTAMAHLAGAMGVPVFLLVPHAPDWRWGLGAAQCRWYPSATLVRQPAPLDWEGAIVSLQSRLHAPG